MKSKLRIVSVKILMVLILTSASKASIAADMIYLDCHGKETQCGTNKEVRSCDSPVDKIYTAQWDGVSMKNIDIKTAPAMTFKEGCSQSEERIYCFERYTSQYAGDIIRSLDIERSTGHLALSHVIIFNDLLRKNGYTKSDMSFDGYCSARKERNLL